jgi:hypothetical protein
MYTVYPTYIISHRTLSFHDNTFRPFSEGGGGFPWLCHWLKQTGGFIGGPWCGFWAQNRKLPKGSLRDTTCLCGFLARTMAHAATVQHIGCMVEKSNWRQAVVLAANMCTQHVWLHKQQRFWLECMALHPTISADKLKLVSWIQCL